ncbi:MAG: phospho-sugar mutase, partial [Oscillospiraceae bacterium]|nr:phospho-sugar mutase [Oscillospiraceae bacterium]
RYIFGFEESYGYLSGPHVRDKDAVNASLLICEMAGWYKRQGKTLAQAMDALYAEFGVYQNQLHSTAFEGQDGMERMQNIMAELRAQPPKELAGAAVVGVTDYKDSAATGLPAANVLEFRLEGEGKLMIRPSGTEPKIKLYVSARGATEAEAAAAADAIAAAGRELLN